MVFSFFLFLISYQVLVSQAHKMPLQKRVKIIITALEYGKKKKEVISTTELIRDRKIAIILVLIKLHYFLAHHEIMFLVLLSLVRLINNNGVFKKKWWVTIKLNHLVIRPVQHKLFKI